MSKKHHPAWYSLYQTAKEHADKDRQFLKMFMLILPGSLLFAGLLIFFIQDGDLSGFAEFFIMVIVMVVLLAFLIWFYKKLQKPPLLLKGKLLEIKESGYSGKQHKKAIIEIVSVVDFNQSGMLKKTDIQPKTTEKLMLTNLLNKAADQNSNYWFLTISTGTVVDVLIELPE